VKAKNNGPLTEQELMHLAQHAVENSHDLLNEAGMLFEGGRWARAGALAVLAVEESGKAQLCHVWSAHIIPTRDDMDDPGTWADFWNSFVDHPDKLDRLMSRADGVGRCQDFGAWKEVAHVLHTNKLRCLYVDWLSGSGQGVLMTPSNITEQDAREMVELSRDFLRLVEGVRDSEQKN